nr:PREDICTED: uncharacterized protein LOC100554036 [Anolis carolinensis]|eukprot:XP_016848791.1 PREDICTED: uncharacterized protein LOC100554036 [Anolis carolinensis]
MNAVWEHFDCLGSMIWNPGACVLGRLQQVGGQPKEAKGAQIRILLLRISLHFAKWTGLLGKEAHWGNEVLQDLQEDEGVSMVVDSMADVKDCSVEEEKEHLLKEDEQTEPPKAEVSPWNRLINMYKQRRRLPASKVTHQVIPPQPLIEDEATLDLMIYGMAAPKAHVTLSNSSGADCAYGLPETEARENAGDCEVTEKNAGSNDEASLEHPKNVY